MFKPGVKLASGCGAASLKCRFNAILLVCVSVRDVLVCGTSMFMNLFMRKLTCICLRVYRYSSK